MAGAVWITRTRPGADALARTLTRLGQASVIAPVLDIEDSDDWQRTAKAAAEHRTEPRQVLLTSRAAAARYLASPLWDHVQALASPPPHIAVGSGSAAVLAEALAEANVVLSHPEQQDSEGVLAMTALEALPPGSVVWLMAGEGGREALVRTLSGRGLTVFRFALYRRVPTLVADFDADHVCAIEVASAEAAAAMDQIWRARHGRRDVPVVCVSQRVGARLLELGYDNVHNAATATPEAVATRLATVISDA